MEFIQQLSEEQLPATWQNTITQRGPDEFIIRSNVHTLADCSAWVKEFSLKSSTQWISRSSKPYSTNKIDCQKIFVCHHNTFNKTPTDDRNNNKRGISKSTACSAKLTVTVKVTTRNTKRTDEFVKNGMPGIIRIRARHNHPLDSPSALAFLSPPKSLEEEFYGYFELGMDLSTASHYHESKLLFEDDDFDSAKYDLNNNSVQESSPEIDAKNVIDNPRFNPRKRSVVYWYTKWRKANFGSRDGADLQTKLDEKIAQYSSEGTTVRYSSAVDSPFVLVVLTPIMKRVHQCSFAKDILFIDTTSCCDHDNYALTFLLSASPCGAVPCGLIITKDQTMDSFSAGFQMVTDIVTDEIGACFYNQNYPSVIMTDNCSAEIGAALKVWPSSVSLLCIFHVLQYVLRWLQDSAHKIPKVQQRDFMSTFQTILYCTNTEEADNAYESAMAIAYNFPAWQNYLRTQYEMKEKWCLAYRVGITAHHTNNYAEISIRLFKENVLDRVKAYNIVALMDFVTNTMEYFYKRKLQEFYSSRDRKNHLFLQRILKRTDYLQKEHIKMVGEHLYEVPSENTPNEVYIVDSKVGLCNCKAGCAGKFCKHIAAVYKFFDMQSNKIPSVTIDGRRTMAFIALGKAKMPPLEYFLPLHVNTMTESEQEAFLNRSDEPRLSTTSTLLERQQASEPDNNATRNQQQNSTDANQHNSSTQQAASETELTSDSDDNDNLSTQDESGPVFEKILSLLALLNEKFGTADVSEFGARKFFARLSKLKSAGQWTTFLHTAAKSVPLRRATGAKIKVQPTAVARRKSANRSRQRIAVKRFGRIAPKKNDRNHRISSRLYG